MRSSPEVVVWQPLESGVFGASAPLATSWSFERAFDGRGAVTEAPEPFVVSEQVGVPPAVLTEARRAARSEGYAAGFASGVSDAIAKAVADEANRRASAERVEASARADLARAVAALQVAQAQLATRTEVSLTEMEQLLLDSAFELAEALVGATLRDHATRGEAAVRRALALLPADMPVTVALHPDDLATIGAEMPADVTLVADHGVARGDAVARSGDTTVEARLADAVARARQVLSR